MKKILLLAAAAVTLSASAQLTLEKKWQNKSMPEVTNDCRQGVGHNGKFYINDKVNQTVLVYGPNGVEGQLPGSPNCGIALDQAGNLVLSAATFPNSWNCAGADYDGTVADVNVVNPETGETKELCLPAGAVMGRSDFMGHAKGNLMEDGELYLVGATQTGVARIVVSEGEVSEDDSYEALIEGATPTTNTVVNAWVNADGEDMLLYVTRNAAPLCGAFEGDNIEAAALTLPNKGACNGAQAFALAGKNYVVYPTLPNYQDGFAVAEIGAEEAEFEHMETGVQANGIQANWLNVEVVDDYTAVLYEYQPAGHMTVFEIKAPMTAINDLTVKAEKVYKTVENGQVVIVKGNARYNVAGQAIK